MKTMQTLRFGDPFFETAILRLMISSGTNPIYAPDFSLYYQECHVVAASNKSLVVMEDLIPIVGMIHSHNENVPQEIGYFGLPAQFLASNELSKSTLDEASILLLQEMKNDGVPINHGKFSKGFQIEINPIALRARRIERLFFSGSNVEPRFDRILNISENLPAEYSKSVKHSLKQLELNVELVSSQNSISDITVAIDNLKRLHFESAGRSTRSDASWAHQAKMIETGAALLVQGSLGNEVVTSSFFMRNSSAVFYAVSASSRSQLTAGLSHHLIDYAIRKFGDFGVEEIWLGDQHTDSFKMISAKELRIQEFKSYFGGSIQTHLISSSRL